MSRRRGAFIIATAVLAAVLILAGIYIYFNRSNANKVKRFKQSAVDTWTKLSGQAEKVKMSLAKVASPADLSGVSKAAVQMEKLINTVDRSLKENPVPSGYKKVSEEQKTAVGAVKSYLEKVRELASDANEKTFLRDRWILEDRSRKALSAVNEFLSNANIVRVNISDDFFQAAKAMETAWQPPKYADEAEADAVYDAANAFLNADVKESNFNKVWSMVSSRRITALNQLGFSKETIESGWRKLWNDETPVDYYVSKNSINFSDPNTATIKAAVNLESGSSKVETLRLVKEGGAWKVEDYPFVGWN